MNITLGNYYPSESSLHRLDPRTKLLSTLAFMILLFVLHSFYSIVLYGVFLLALIKIARLPLSLVLKSLRSVLFLATFAFVINIFSVNGKVILALGPLAITEEGLILGIRMALRLFFLVMTTTVLLTLTTTPLLISDAIEALFKPLAKIGFPAHELAMMMSIVLRFVPTLIEESDKIMKAQSSRGADYDTGSFFTKIKGLISVLVPLFVSAFKRADELAIAMEARCYRGAEGRTKMTPLKYKKIDLVFALGFLVATALFVAVEFLL